MKNPFKRKKYASPYYGGKEPLANASALPLKKEETKPVLDISQVRIPYPRPNEADWEQRRFELVKMLVGQDRRSVVLGKLQATNKQIAESARKLADAAIKELQTHPFKSHDEVDRGAEADDHQRSS